jgi:ribosome-associated heat shock protein Hsp15
MKNQKPASGQSKSSKIGHSKMSSNDEPVRLDKWLWAARFTKTRSIARDLIQSGKVTINQQRAKPSRAVEIGSQLKIPVGFDIKIVVVEKIFDKRQSAPLAQTMYTETEESVVQREKNAQARQLSAFHSPKPDNRPDKKQRRQIIKFKHQ